MNKTCPTKCPAEVPGRDALKNNLDRMRARICELEKKVVSYDTVVAEKEELREQMADVGKWVDQVTNKHKEMFAQLSANYDALYAKHQETKAVVSKLRCEKDKLNDDNERLTEQLRSLKRNEQHLTAEIDKLENDKKRVKHQLCEIKTEVNDLNNEMAKMQCSLNGKEESICAFRKQLDDSRREHDRSRDAVRRLECDLKRTNEEMASVKACSAKTEQKLTLERDTLSNELECKRRKLCELQTVVDEQKCTLRDQKAVICKSEAMVADLTAANERDRRDAVARIRKLTEENCGIREEIGRKNREIEELRRKNDCQASEMDDQKRQMNTLNCAVDEMRGAVEKIKRGVNNKGPKPGCNKQESRPKCTKIAEQPSSVCCAQKVSVDSCSCPSEPCDDVHALIEKYSSSKRDNECDDGCGGGGSDDREKLVCEIQGLNEQLSALKNAVMCGRK